MPSWRSKVKGKWTRQGPKAAPAAARQVSSPDRSAVRAAHGDQGFEDFGDGGAAGVGEAGSDGVGGDGFGRLGKDFGDGFDAIGKRLRPQEFAAFLGEFFAGRCLVAGVNGERCLMRLGAAGVLVFGAEPADEAGGFFFRNAWHCGQI